MPDRAPAARAWFSAGDLAEMRLPGMPTEKKNVLLLSERMQWTAPELENSGWRKREGRGGGVEYHYSVLPTYAQAPIVAGLAQANSDQERETARRQSKRAEIWAWWDRQPDARKAKGKARVEALDKVAAYMKAGTDKLVAMRLVAEKHAVSVSTLYNWEEMVAGADRCDWMAFLTPRHVGRTATVECDPQAWEFIKADYLRPEQPNFTACYRRLQEVAAKEQWKIPSEDTLKRRIDALPAAMRELTRRGEDALKVLYPAQKRDRGVFHALEAVNADGYKWDVFVKWPDGVIGRPMMVAFQDLYSGKILSWRVDRSENRESVRLAFGDMLENYGIPSICYLDNGRGFAAKWLTGGTPNRFRFKVRDDDPVGIMTQLGVDVHWTTPYSGQSKPIERAFRDLAQDAAKHPAFAGAYVGNSPCAKPANYGQKAVPIDVFLKTIGGEIAAHNARAGRRTAIAAGRSFDQVFDCSYAISPIKKASEEQRRLWLMAAESVLVQKRDGTIEFQGNTYWHEKLHELRGQRVVVRFDPELLHEPLHVYRLAGTYVTAAECRHAVGFNSAEAARDHARQRRMFLRGVKMQRDAEIKLDIAAVAAMLPAPAEETLPETKIVRAVFGNAALQQVAEAGAAARQEDVESLFVRANANRQAQRGQHLQLVEDADDD